MRSGETKSQIAEAMETMPSGGAKKVTYQMLPIVAGNEKYWEERKNTKI